MGVIGIILSNIRNMKKAKRIRSMPRAELLAMEDGDFYDAMECVCSDAIYDLGEQKDLPRELVLAYTLIKLEVEVNNGGLCQFFVNSSRECAPYVSEALGEIGAPEIQALFDNFVKDNGLDVRDLSSFKISRISEFEEQCGRFDFDAFDEKFYEDFTLHQKILEYLREHMELIVK